jgi:hypothetical protein
VQLIAAHRNDSNVVDRLTEVQSTYERFEKKASNITGLPTLAQLIAPAQAELMKSRLREWLGPIPDTEAEPAPVGLSQYVWTLPQLLAIDLPEPEYLVQPFLPTASLSEVFAERGSARCQRRLKSDPHCVGIVGVNLTHPGL